MATQCLVGRAGRLLPGSLHQYRQIGFAGFASDTSFLEGWPSCVFFALLLPSFLHGLGFSTPSCSSACWPLLLRASFAIAYRSRPLGPMVISTFPTQDSLEADCNPSWGTSRPSVTSVSASACFLASSLPGVGFLLFSPVSGSTDVEGKDAVLGTH